MSASSTRRFLRPRFVRLRFGVNEAHGKGMAMQVNYMMDKGGFIAHPDGTFEVNFDKIRPAVRELDHDLLTIEATRRLCGGQTDAGSAGCNPAGDAESAERSGSEIPRVT